MLHELIKCNFAIIMSIKKNFRKVLFEVAELEM